MAKSTLARSLFLLLLMCHQSPVVHQFRKYIQCHGNWSLPGHELLHEVNLGFLLPQPDKTIRWYVESAPQEEKLHQEVEQGYGGQHQQEQQPLEQLTQPATSGSSCLPGLSYLWQRGKTRLCHPIRLFTQLLEVLEDFYVII